MVACVAGEPVAVTDAISHLRAPEPVPGQAALPDARALAVDAAIRVQLFAAEARRRGLDAGGGGPTRRLATLHQALIKDELARLHIGPDQVSDEVAEAFYAAHPAAISRIDVVRVRAIFVSDPHRAEELFRRAAQLDEQGFAALAAAESQDVSAAQGGELGPIDVTQEVYPMDLVRVAFDLRDVGALGGPVRLADGRFVILRSTEVRVRAETFATVASRVKAHLARADKVSALDALADRLRREHTVEVFDEVIARLPAPPPRAAPARPSSDAPLPQASR